LGLTTLAAGYYPGVRATVAVLVATLTVLCAGASASASAATSAKGGSFTQSGQETGTLTLNAAETCMADNFSASSLSDDIRLYLTDHGLKPTSASWFLLIEAKAAGTVRYPANSPNIVSLGADSGLKPDVLWSTRYGEPGVGSGTLRLMTGLKSGSIDLVLPPSTGATRSEKIVGHWSCK
jgi:hypothetical protein